MECMLLLVSLYAQSFTQAVTVPAGQSAILQLTIRLATVTNVRWTGALVFENSDGTTFRASISGNYAATLVGNTCSESVRPGATTCQCDRNCGQVQNMIVGVTSALSLGGDSALMQQLLRLYNGLPHHRTETAFLTMTPGTGGGEALHSLTSAALLVLVVFDCKMRRATALAT